MSVQCNLHVAETCSTTVIFRRREVSPVWRSSFSYCIWDENICPLFGGVRCIEVSVDGFSAVLMNVPKAHGHCVDHALFSS